jgi:uncharacterized protein (TIGR03435 family)
LIALMATLAFAQPAPTFEVASIKPSAPLDMMKLASEIQAGHMPKIGARVDGARAEYTYVSLKELIVIAYKVKPFQITGPDWMASQRFDIVAKIPDGASKDDVPKMLQALLEERFKLAAHRDSKEQPVLALLVGKGGPKMKEFQAPPAETIDENAPLKPGEMKLDGADGPVRVTVGKTGTATMDMGAKGSVTYKMDPATQTMHLEATKVTMGGFADMLTQFSQMTGGGRQVVDMTELKGDYQVALDFALADLMNIARSSGVAIGAGGGAAPASLADAASDPSGASSLLAAVQALGLRLEPRKSVLEQLIVDHVEKTPTEN